MSVQYSVVLCSILTIFTVFCYIFFHALANWLRSSQILYERSSYKNQFT